MRRLTRMLRMKPVPRIDSELIARKAKTLMQRQIDLEIRLKQAEAREQLRPFADEAR